MSHAAFAPLLAAVLPVMASAPAAPDPADTWIQAGAALKAGDNDKAVALYEELVGAGYADGFLLYNLGNAYLREGKLGKAIAAYRRAEQDLPRDEDLAANLAFARQRAKDALSPPAPSPVLRTLFFWHYALSQQEEEILLAVVSLLFWAAMGWLALSRRPLARVASVVFGLVLLALAPSWVIRIAAPRRVAVVQASEVDVRAGTGTDAVVRFRLHEGAEAAVYAIEEGYVRIALANGEQGWVRAADVAIVGADAPQQGP